MPRNTASAHSSAQQQQDLILDSVGIENFELPKSIVMKIAKSALPDNAKLSKETITALVKGSTVFINYLTATAHEVALSHNRKTISAADILSALEIVQLDQKNKALEAELKIFRELSKQGTSGASGRKATAPKKASQPASASTYKAKGKAKATEPPPAPLPAPVQVIESASTGPTPMVVDDQVEADEAAEESEIEEEPEEDEEDAEEEEAIWDTVAAEEEELNIDAKGLDAVSQPSTRMAEDT